MPRRSRDIVGSVLTLIMLLALVVFIDHHVHGDAVGLTDVSSVARQVPSSVSRIVSDLRWNPAVDNVYLGAFLLAGVALVTLMLKT